MLCQNCKKNEATTHIKRVINGEATQSHLCRSCAQSLGMGNFFDDFALNMPSIFSGFFDDTVFALSDARLERCEKCGSSFDDIIKSGRVGCAQCYEKFYSKLLPSIQRIHGKAKHSGKVPPVHGEAVHSGKGPERTAEPIKSKEPTLQEKIAVLEEQMKKAIDEQNFEQAAVLRDEIKKLKGEN